MSNKSVLVKKYGLSISESSTYDDIRFQLLKHNFIYKSVFRMLSSMIDKAKNDKGMRFFVEHLEQFEKLRSVLYQQIFIGGKASKNQSDIIIAGEDGARVESEGIYVRFHPLLSKADWLQLYKKLQFAEKQLGIYKDSKNKKRQKPKQRKQIGTKDLEQNLEIYLDIETRIPKFWKQKHSKKKEDYAGTGEKIQIPVIEAAITEIAEEKGIQSLEEESKFRDRYKEIYNRIIERYELPTIREYSSYARILDEIVS
jgi:hypothetical protein